MGQSYILGCPADGQERLLTAVHKVDAAMCKIRDAGKIKARDRIAVLAALNLAFDQAELVASIHSSSASVADLPQPSQERLTKLLARLDQSPGLEHWLVSVIISRQMNPTPVCPRPPEPPVQDAGPVALADTFFTPPPHMIIEPVLLAQLSVLGLCTGFLAGLLGIGGGLIMVPVITYLLGQRGVSPDLAVKMAIATSMATIIFTSVSSVRAHHQKKAVRWDLVKGLAPGIVIGSLIGSLAIFAFAKGSWLALFFAAFVGFSATQMFLDKKPAPTRQMPGFSGQLGIGGLIGLLSGLVGAGGGFISVPFMTWCNVAIHNAVATSAALGFPIALANVAGYIVSGQRVQNLPDHSFGYLWLPALVVVALCSVTMAPLGASTAHKLPVKQLKRVFASILYTLAAYMLYKGLSA
eukprot:gene17069-19459_t